MTCVITVPLLTLQVLFAVTNSNCCAIVETYCTFAHFNDNLRYDQAAYH